MKYVIKVIIDDKIGFLDECDTPKQRITHAKFFDTIESAEKKLKQLQKQYPTRNYSIKKKHDLSNMI